MSLIYLLDGYNIIKRIPRLAQKKLEDSRASLIHFIEIHRPQGSLNNTVTIVFDGQPGMIGQSGSQTVRVVFSKGESADDCIKKMVLSSRNSKRMVVVTGDKDIKFFVRSQGASVVSVDEFMGKVFEDREKRPTLPEDAKHIPKTLEYEITSELERIWLHQREKENQK